MHFPPKLLIAATLLCLWEWGAEPVFASQSLNKDSYDIRVTQGQGLAKTAADPLMALIAGTALEACLLPGGFFTLGTVNGRSSSPLDDRCPLLFGHPFAKTSYPLFKINGKWGKADRFIPLDNCVISSNATMARMTFPLAAQGLDVAFSLSLNAAQPFAAPITITIINNSAAVKNVQAAIVMDPAMGTRTGDAGVYVHAAENAAENIATPGDSIVLTEKKSGMKGLRMQCVASGQPLAKAIIGNWASVMQSDTADTFDASAAAPISDVCIKSVFTAKNLAPGDTYTAVMTVQLLDPEFGTGLFGRWETPRNYIIENGMLFPPDPVSQLIIYNSSTIAAPCSVKAVLPSFMTADSLPFAATVSPLAYFFKTVPLHIREHYVTDLTPALSMQIIGTANNSDAITFPAFVPASPFTNTGLTVAIDSFFLSGATRNVTFSVKKSADSSYIFNLIKENVFVYENGVAATVANLTKDTTRGASAVDIVFVLDVTGSMGNEIAGVQNNIVQFADAMSKKGIDFRFGMVTFLDAVENTYALTNDVAAFQGYVRAQNAHAGGDAPENSLQALTTASQMSFRPNAKVKFIWITDASYHVLGDGSGFTSLQTTPVVNGLLAKGITVFSIGPVEYQVAWYMPVYDPTGGQFYDINGNFQDILLDIANMNSSKNYLLSFTASTAYDTSHSIVLEVHAQGLGGKDTIGGQGGLFKTSGAPQSGVLAGYSADRRGLRVSLANAAASKISISLCDLQGRTVFSEHISPQQAARPLVFSSAGHLGTGVYFLKISSLDIHASRESSTIRRINILR